MMNFGYNVWGLLILAGDIWAIINIFQSSVSNEKKLLWTLSWQLPVGPDPVFFSTGR
jgi:hypothetical protein